MTLRLPKNLAGRQVRLDLSDERLGSVEALGQRGPFSPGGLQGGEHDAEFLVGESVEAQVARHQATVRRCVGEASTPPYARNYGKTPE